jgi:4-amino-4-deoxy-L-arabinose transferase-like glycosyltransferase
MRSSKIYLIAAALLLALAGQVTLSAGRTLAGVIAYSGSFLILFVLVRSGRSPEALTELERRLLRSLAHGSSVRPRRIAGSIAALVAVTIAHTISDSQRPSDAYWPSFLIWLAGVGALVFGFLPPFEEIARRPLRQVWRKARVEIAVVSALTLLAFALRAIHLESLPYPMSGDEGSVGLEGRRILNGTLTNMFVAGWSSQPVLSFLWPAISMRLFGEDLLGLRLSVVLVGSLTVPALYLLARAMFDRVVATVAAFLLAVMALHVHFSRIAVNNIDTTLFGCVVFFLVYRALETRRTGWFVAAGLASGFAVYSFAGTRLAPILAAAILLLSFAANRSIRSEWRKFLLFVFAAGVAVLPIAIYFLRHPDIAFARVNQAGVFKTGWLASEVARTGLKPIPILLQQVLHSFGVFVWRPAIAGFYNSPKPLLDSAWALAFMTGLMFSLFDIRQRRHVILQLWFWSVVVLGGALTTPPPSAERLLMAAPAVALLTAWGIHSVWSQLGGSRPWFVRGAMIATSVFLAVTSVRFYFFEYGPRYYFAEANAEVATELGRQLAAAPPGTHVFFLGHPRMGYRSLPSLAFLSGGVPGTDVLPGGSAPKLGAVRGPRIYVALPHRKEQLRAFAGIEGSEALGVVWRRPKPAEPLYYFYRADSGSRVTDRAGAGAP